jgi:hypothetical protein
VALLLFSSLDNPFLLIDMPEPITGLSLSTHTRFQELYLPLDQMNLSLLPIMQEHSIAKRTVASLSYLG